MFLQTDVGTLRKIVSKLREYDDGAYIIMQYSMCCIWAIRDRKACNIWSTIYKLYPVYEIGDMPHRSDWIKSFWINLDALGKALPEFSDKEPVKIQFDGKNVQARIGISNRVIYEGNTQRELPNISNKSINVDLISIAALCDDH